MEPIGLRERKKARTYDQIAIVAQRLFQENGYDATTLEEVAAAADVHKRTLLRYFPSKAHLVLHRRMHLLDEFLETLANRNKTPVLVLWRKHVMTNAPGIAKRGAKLNVTKLTDETPELNRELVLIQLKYQNAIQRELEIDYPKIRDRELITHTAAAALVGANFSLASAFERRQQFNDYVASLLRVIDLVQDRLLKA